MNDQLTNEAVHIYYKFSRGLRDIGITADNAMIKAACYVHIELQKYHGEDHTHLENLKQRIKEL